jgi:hypothetical protein
MIGQGQLTNSGITAQDGVRSDLGSLKSKTTSHKAQLEEELPVVRTKQFESQTMYHQKTNTTR